VVDRNISEKHIASVFQIEDRGNNISKKRIAFISWSEDVDGMLF